MSQNAPDAAREIILHYRRNDLFKEIEAFAYGINKMLRDGLKLTDAQTESVRVLDQAIFQATRTEEPQVLFRGCSIYDFNRCSSNQEFLSPAFLSLSRNPLEAASFALGDEAVFIQVCIPTGTPLLLVSDESAGSLESQEWLPPRCSKFRIKSWDDSALSFETESVLQIRIPSARRFRLELNTWS
jgi:hypothetical protein